MKHVVDVYKELDEMILEGEMMDEIKKIAKNEKDKIVIHFDYKDDCKVFFRSMEKEFKGFAKTYERSGSVGLQYIQTHTFKKGNTITKVKATILGSGKTTLLIEMSTTDIG